MNELDLDSYILRESDFDPQRKVLQKDVKLEIKYNSEAPVDFIMTSAELSGRPFGS